MHEGHTLSDLAANISFIYKIYSGPTKNISRYSYLTVPNHFRLLNLSGQDMIVGSNNTHPTQLGPTIGNDLVPSDIGTSRYFLLDMSKSLHPFILHQLNC
jgi:hypothetical protein